MLAVFAADESATPMSIMVGVGRGAQAGACRQAALLPLGLGMLHLLRGLFHWPIGPTQAWAGKA